MKYKKLLAILLVAIVLAIFLPNVNVFAQDSAEPKVYSEAALLIDSNTGKILFSKNENEKKYPASTTKILTAILAIENCNLDDVVTVDYDSIMQVPAGYTVAALQVGEQLTVKQLLQVMLIHSANDAANVLAKHVGGSMESFESMMNSKLSEIGCENSHFTNPSGKHDNNHYTTAVDLAKIMNYCIKNDTFKEISSSKYCIIPATNKYEERMYTNSNELLVKDTREISSNYYYPYVIAGKTGYTAEAKNCLVSVAKKDDLQLICVVLGGVRTDDGLSARFVDSKNLFEYGYNNFILKKIRDTGSIAKQIEVPKATKDTKDLDLITTNEIIALINQNNLDKEFEPEIILNDNIEAPITEGDTIGKLTYNIEGIEYTTNLVASHSVKKDNSLFFFIQLILIGIILYLLYKFLFMNNNQRKTKIKNKYNFNYLKNFKNFKK